MLQLLKDFVPFLYTRAFPLDLTGVFRPPDLMLLTPSKNLSHAALVGSLNTP